MSFKSYRKFIASSMVAVMAVSAAVPASAAASFTDVNKNYITAVNYLVENDIAKGVSDSKFGTDNPIKRGDVAVMIANAIGLNTSAAPASGFKDLNARVKGAVNALYAKGIINGKSKTQFQPDANITRAEMAKVLANAYELDGEGVTNQFTDVNSTFDPYVDALVKNNITLGITETKFGATNDVTRGQFALFVYRHELSVNAVPDIEVKSVGQSAEIEANEGAESVNLPEQVEVTLTNGEKALKMVKWNRSNLNLDKPGEYILTGDVADTELEATVKVIIQAVEPQIVKVSAINSK